MCFRYCRLLFVLARKYALPNCLLAFEVSPFLVQNSASSNTFLTREHRSISDSLPHHSKSLSIFSSLVFKSFLLSLHSREQATCSRVIDYRQSRIALAQFFAPAAYHLDFRSPGVVAISRASDRERAGVIRQLRPRLSYIRFGTSNSLSLLFARSFHLPSSNVGLSVCWPPLARLAANDDADAGPSSSRSFGQ